MSILRDIQDPRVQGVTITYVEVSGDMQLAKIHVSVMGNEAKQNLCLKGLQHAAGYFQRKIADRIQTRYTPRIQFVLDHGVKNSILVSQILKEVLPSNEEEKTAEESVEAVAETAAETAEVSAEEVVEEETNNENG